MSGKSQVVLGIMNSVYCVRALGSPLRWTGVCVHSFEVM